METKINTSIEISTTDRVSLNTWRGLTRLEVHETRQQTLEVAGIDTAELLCAMSYWIRTIATAADRSERETRLLADILATLTDSLATKEPAA